MARGGRPPDRVAGGRRAVRRRRPDLGRTRAARADCCELVVSATLTRVTAGSCAGRHLIGPVTNPVTGTVQIQSSAAPRRVVRSRARSRTLPVDAQRAYQWYVDGAPVSGATGDLLHAQRRPTSAGRITLTGDRVAARPGHRRAGVEHPRPRRRGAAARRPQRDRDSRRGQPADGAIPGTWPSRHVVDLPLAARRRARSPTRPRRRTPHGRPTSGARSRSRCGATRDGERATATSPLGDHRRRDADGSEPDGVGSARRSGRQLDRADRGLDVGDRLHVPVAGRRDGDPSRHRAPRCGSRRLTAGSGSACRSPARSPATPRSARTSARTAVAALTGGGAFDFTG